MDPLVHNLATVSDLRGSSATANRPPVHPSIAVDAAATAPIKPPGAAARGRRSPRLVIIGVLCAVLGALGVTAAFTQANETRTVVAMARHVPRGVQITQSDLATVTIGSAPGVSTIPSDRLTSLVGQTALVDLPAGSLVPEGAVGPATIQPGRTHLGLKLPAGRLPLETLPPGTPVSLVAVSSAAEGAAGTTISATGQTFAATVTSMPRELPDGTSWVLDVSVNSTDAALVAELAASGRIVLTRTS